MLIASKSMGENDRIARGVSSITLYKVFYINVQFGTIMMTTPSSIDKKAWEIDGTERDRFIVKRTFGKFTKKYIDFLGHPCYNVFHKDQRIILWKTSKLETVSMGLSLETEI